jgi:hypothetical protein
MSTSRYPVLYQINTRVWLTELSEKLHRAATLDDIPDAELDRLAEMGFDWVWFLSVWQTGPGAQQVSRSNAEWRREFQETLPDLREEDIAGSGFAITGYTVHKNLGGDAALARLRERLRKRGLKLMLDFVPNHMGLGHPWVKEHPEYFVRALNLIECPQNYTGKRQRRRLAYGRDPYFSGWPDTLQLNYANPATQEAMIGELLKIGGQCDGVRCDMAMLVLPEVFERTWGQRAPLFWPTATQRVRERVPGFVRTLKLQDLNGPCSSKASITPTTNGFTTASATITPALSVSTFMRGSTIKTSSPASWKTTMSRERPRQSLRRFMRPRQLSRFCLRD